MPPIFQSRRNRAFSLPEVAIAIGIIGFAMVTMMGMLPVGLQSARASREALACSQIERTISSELHQLSFKDLDSYIGASASPAVRYFDESGNQLASTAKDIQYEVTCRRKSEKFFSGADRSNNLSNQIAVLELSILNAVRRSTPEIHTIHVANQGN